VAAPKDGPAIRSGSRVVVSLKEVSFGKLPELRRNAEIQVDAAVRTTARNGRQSEMRSSSGVIYYVRDGGSLGISDWVIFDREVHRHVSLEVEITEVENARKKATQTKDLVTALAQTAGRLSPDLPDPADAVLEMFPRIFGAVLRANADDQILRYMASFYTAEIAQDLDRKRALREGVYTLRKLRTAGAAPSGALVTIKLDVVRARK
jgi:hypothetical protein